MTIALDVIPPQAPPPQALRSFTLARLLGIVFMAMWLAAFVGIVFWMIEGFSEEKFFKYGPKLLSGLLVTIKLVVSSLVLGAILSVPVAMARMSRYRIFSIPANVYIYAFRGTPLITQLYLIYYGFGDMKAEMETIGLWWFFREAYNCALLSFTLNTAAYQAEILRGAIESVPRGQREACDALGMHKLDAFRKVIVPQAVLVALRPYGNEIILMLKGSAIVAIVTVFDLMGETRRAFSRTYDFQLYLWAAILYLVIVETIRNIWNKLEAYLMRHLKR